MSSKIYYYRCKHCKSLVTIYSKNKLPEKRICPNCKLIMDSWKDGAEFWKLLNEGKIAEARKLIF